MECKLTNFILGTITMSLVSLTLKSAELTSIGYVPVSFPRDPITVNQYDEHVILGQILEPLIENDGKGQIIPGVAKKWETSADGLSIKFDLGDHKFSNGNIVNSKDVKYSIERHINSESSQSKNFLKSIKEVKIISASKLELVLIKPDVSIFKSLSRDQIGIVPNLWTFDANSEEPYAGSGAYTLAKKGKNWILKLNPYYHSKNTVKFENLKLVFYADSSYKLPSVVPDIIPAAPLRVKSDLEKNYKSDFSKRNIKEKISLSQTSFWFYPESPSYGKNSKMRRIMDVIDQAIGTFVKDESLERATGMIPKGVEGSSLDKVEIKILDFEEKIKIEKIKIAFLGGVFNSFFLSPKVLKVLKSKGVEFEYIEFSAQTINKIAEFKPDLIAASWAGGFYDPMGFLPLVSTLIKKDFSEYIGELGPVFIKAQSELDWTKRSELFRSINEKLMTNGVMTPGWKTPIYSIYSKDIIEAENLFRYSPRLVNYESSKK